MALSGMNAAASLRVVGSRPISTARMKTSARRAAPQLAWSMRQCVTPPAARARSRNATDT